MYTIGHRDQLGLAIHPDTGAVFSNENGPNGGDELNLILPGRNYGWPIFSFGRGYDGARLSEMPLREGIEAPGVALGSYQVMVGRSSGDIAWTGRVTPAAH